MNKKQQNLINKNLTNGKNHQPFKFNLENMLQASVIE